MSRAMTFEEFNKLLEHVSVHNSPFSVNRQRLPVVKYIDPVFSMRTLEVFSIRFRGYGTEIDFGTTNEEIDIPESLFDRCMTYLTTPRNATYEEQHR